MKAKKKSKKLLLQIALVLMPVFILLLIAVLWIMYTTTVDGFLEAQKTNMQMKLDVTANDVIDLVFPNDDLKRLIIESWEKDPTLCNKRLTDEEYEIYRNFMNSYKGYAETIECTKDMPEDVKRVYLRSKNDELLEMIKIHAERDQYDQVFVIDIDEQHFGQVFCSYDKLNSVWQLGDKCDLDRSEHPAIDKILESGSDDVEFERSDDFPEIGDYYIAYKPVQLDGKNRRVIGVAYDWNDLRKTLEDSLQKAYLLGIGGIMLAMILPLIVLYRRAVKPVKKIQSAVEEYSDDKSSKDIVAKMYEIKSGNELEYLADSISDLALEIDHYTKENIRIASERERAEKELYEAKVQVMVSQIRPHFMYNALSSIAMLCTLDPERAQEATVTFADYLRGNMDSLKQTAPMPFETELEHLKKYLYIEKLRFGKKLNIVYDIQATDFKVPLLSIQPLVENAVKHGVGMKKKGGTVTISTKRTDSGYEIIIADDGVGFDTNAPKKNDGRSHVGMENTKKRLKDLCGADVVITSTVGEGTTVRVILPKEEQDNEDTVR